MIGTVALTATLIPGGLAGADDDPTDANDPAAWTTAPAVNPDMDQLANVLRFFGATRYNTNHATTLFQLGDASGAEFPFGTSDRTGTLSDENWFGNEVDPCTIIVAAGDVASDSLAASGLVRQGSTTLPVMVDIHGDERAVPTDFAVIIITQSTRQGASGLNAQALRAIRDFKDTSDQDSGRCDGGLHAVISGGPAAVPSGVEAELEAEGFFVYRLNGFNRHDTARQTSFAIGTEDTGSAECGDPTTADGETNSFIYAVSVIEWRSSTTDCTRLNRTVFLFNGFAEADALMAGVYMAYWGIPGLTTAEDGSLPSFTENALQVLDVDNIVVIGGTARIPTSTEGDAAQVAGISTDNVFRIAGDTRTGTSIDGAQKLAGWFPTGDGDDFHADQLCIGGSGPGDIGFPDLLGAGPVCAARSDTDTQQPEELMLPPVNGAEPGRTDVEIDHSSAHTLVPLFLTPTGTGLHADLVDFFGSTFDPDANWCSSDNSDGCDTPGFAYAFGGPASLDPDALSELSTLISGGTYTEKGDVSPTLTEGFGTSLPMNAVFGASDGTGYYPKVCFMRNGAPAGTDVRWLSVYENAQKTVFDTEYDVVFDGEEDLYRTDADGAVRTPGELAPACVEIQDDGEGDFAADNLTWVFGASLSGHFTDAQMFDGSEENLLFVDGRDNGGWSIFRAWRQEPPLSATTQGESAGDCEPGNTDDPDDPCTATTTWEWDSTGNFGTLTVRGESHQVEELSIEITVTRGGANDCTTATPCPPDTFDALFQVVTDGGFFQGTAHGEAVESVTGDGWALRGMSVFDNGDLGTDWSGGEGGFAAFIDFRGTSNTDTATDLDDDSLLWEIDGLVS